MSAGDTPTPITDRSRFTIRWDSETGAYRVNRPCYQGGSVVPVEVAEEIEQKLSAAKAEMRLQTQVVLRTCEINRFTPEQTIEALTRQCNHLEAREQAAQRAGEGLAKAATKLAAINPLSRACDWIDANREMREALSAYEATRVQ